MADSLEAAVGRWSGVNRLYMLEEEMREAPSEAVFEPAAGGQFYTLRYTWSYEGQPQDGLLLFNRPGEQGAVEVYWVDSWHMGDLVLHSRGEAVAGGALVVRGTYRVGDSPEWGWRTDISAASDALNFIMYNVSPEGEEYLAVEALFTREGSGRSG